MLRGRILELPDRVLDEGLVRATIELPMLLAEALDLHVLVAWGEFQELASISSTRGAPDPLPLMRAVWQRHRQVAYVISGSQRTMLSELVTSEHSPFFQHFSLMELGAFPDDDAVQLLVRCAPKDRQISEQLARRAVEVLGGHPFYLQLLGEVLTTQPPPYDEASLKEAIQQLLFSRTGRLALFLENTYRKLVGRSSYLAALLKALCDGPMGLADIARAIGAPSGATVRYIERLQDALEHLPDGRYAICDHVLGLWLKWRKPGGTVVPMTLVGDEAEIRVAEHLARMGFDLVYQSRASRGAFDLLATRGSGQLGLQVKRSSLPLRFGLSTWKRMKAEGERFGWRWVVAAVIPKTGADIILLDPAGARVGRQVRLHADAAIENLLLWLDRSP